jgi:cation transport ATPase
MNLLMSIAVVGAVFIKAWDEAASVVFLFSLAELLESYSLARARRAISALMELAPDTALLKTGEVPVAQVKIGDIVLIRPGARIPLDGVVASGESSVNQAPITGESMPVEKKPGSDMFAGTINERGSLEVRVTKLSTESTLAKIIHLVEEAQEQKAPAQPSETFQSITGKGAEGRVDGHDYFIGNHRLVEEMAVCSPATEQRIEEIERRAQTAIVVGHRPHADCKGEVLGVIAVGDTIRPQAVAAIQQLRDAGVRRIVMLTGDNRVTAEAIAKQAGITEFIAELLPDEKVERVRELLASDQHVGMVGDGVNDAPSLAAAWVGIAMGVAGTDAALETADVALMADDLGKLPEAIALGRRAGRIIQADIAFSILLKVVFLALAGVGIATMWMAVAADMGPTLLVIANALRLLRRS